MFGRRFKSHAASIKGRKEHNEDAFKADDSTGLYIIADGLTGHEPDSANFAVEKLYPTLKTVVRWKHPLIAAHQTKGYLESASRQMYKESQLRNKVGKISTTLDIAMILDNQLYVAHIGDSRVYILNSGKDLVQMTRDDSLVQDRLDQGMMDAMEAKFGPDYYRLTRRFGENQRPTFSEYTHELADTRKILMTTDGLTDVTLDSRIRTILSQDKPGKALVDELVQCYHKPGKEVVDNFLLYSPMPLEWTEDDEGFQRWLTSLSDEGKEVAGLKALKSELSLLRRPGVKYDTMQAFLSKDNAVREAYEKRAVQYLSERDNCTIILIENRRFK